MAYGSDSEYSAKSMFALILWAVLLGIFAVAAIALEPVCGFVDVCKRAGARLTFRNHRGSDERKLTHVRSKS
jgi:hypothetical protein